MTEFNTRNSIRYIRITNNVNNLKMSIEEVAAFADRFATHNERIILTLKDNSILRGHFISNPRLSKKKDNYWNFVILLIDDKNNTKLTVNGDDILDIKKYVFFSYK